MAKVISEKDFAKEIRKANQIISKLHNDIASLSNIAQWNNERYRELSGEYEALRFENHNLKEEIERLKAELEGLKGGDQK